MSPLDDQLVASLRTGLSLTPAQLARAANLPRTNFGRPLTGPVRTALEGMAAAGIVERRGHRYHLPRTR